MSESEESRVQEESIHLHFLASDLGIDRVPEDGAAQHFFEMNADLVGASGMDDAPEHRPILADLATQHQVVGDGLLPGRR